jgi:hypothetical protein
MLLYVKVQPKQRRMIKSIIDRIQLNDYDEHHEDEKQREVGNDMLPHSLSMNRFGEK